MGETPTKKRIIDMAMELFLLEGFNNVTINQICEKSNVNKHTFYYYFKSKDDLLSDFYELPYDVTPEYFLKIMETDNCIEQMWFLFKPFFKLLENAGVDIAKQIFLKNLNENVGTFNANKKMIMLHKIQVSIVTNGQKKGQIQNTSDAEQICIVLHHAILGSAISWCLCGGKFSFPDVVRAQLDTILDAKKEFRETKLMDFSSFWNEC